MKVTVKKKKSGKEARCGEFLFFVKIELIPTFSDHNEIYVILFCSFLHQCLFSSFRSLL